MNPQLLTVGVCAILLSLVAWGFGWGLLGPFLAGVGVGYLGLAFAPDSPSDARTSQRNATRH